MIKIRQLNYPDPKIVVSINNLLPQLAKSLDEPTQLDLEEGLKQKNFHLFLAEDEKSGEIVGMGVIFFLWRPQGWMGEIHTLVVDQHHRRQGFGAILMETLLTAARKFAQKTQKDLSISLTSRPSRKEANNLYKKLGFELISKASGPNGTNLYKILINPRLE